MFWKLGVKGRMEYGGQSHAVEGSVGDGSGKRYWGSDPRLSWGLARKGGGGSGGSSSNSG